VQSEKIFRRRQKRQPHIRHAAAELRVPGHSEMKRHLSISKLKMLRRRKRETQPPALQA
jgi:hypothetical protein